MRTYRNDFSLLASPHAVWIATCTNVKVTSDLHYLYIVNSSIGTYIKFHTRNNISGALRLNNRALKSKELCIPAWQLKNKSILLRPPLPLHLSGRGFPAAWMQGGPAAWVFLEDLQELYVAPGSSADLLCDPGHFASLVWGPLSPFTFCLEHRGRNLQHRNTRICIFGQSSARGGATHMLKSDKMRMNSIFPDQPEKCYASPSPPQDAPRSLQTNKLWEVFN